MRSYRRTWEQYFNHKSAVGAEAAHAAHVEIGIKALALVGILAGVENSMVGKEE